MEEMLQQCSQQMLQFGKVVIYLMPIPIVAGLVNWRHLTSALRVFLAYCLLTFVLNLGDLWYAQNAGLPIFKYWLKITHSNTAFSYILHALKNVILIGWFFQILFSQKQGIWLRLGIIVLSVSMLIGYIGEKGWQDLGYSYPLIETLFICIIPLVYLWTFSKKGLWISQSKNAYLIIAAGLAMVGVFTCLFFFIAPRVAIEDYCLFTRFAIAKNCFEILALLLYAFAFFQAPYARYVKPPN